jgi:hypothetical protein
MNDETTNGTLGTTADDDVDAWKAAKIVGTEEEATLAVGFLNSNGIEAQVESLHASEFPADLGRLGEVHIMVPPDQLAEAQRLLEQAEAAPSAAEAAIEAEGE